MPECPNCGSHVTERYVRVQSDNEGRIHSCCHCDGGHNKPHHVAPDDVSRAEVLRGAYDE